ncbi:MAG: ribonuclease III, partial [Planctomycetota bacterium]|nr:ribonuclease III [Planctomycetota bacterium]
SAETNTQKPSEIAPHINERLEFLGDAVLGLVVSQMLYTKFPLMSEGKMSVIKSHLVSRDVLAKKCRALGIDKFIIVGKGIESLSFPVSVLANVMEALFGAIFLESGYEKTNKIIAKLFVEDIIAGAHEKAQRANYKALLQDYSQQQFNRVPVYKVIKQSGPKHKPIFEIMVYLPSKLPQTGNERYGPGIGNDKKSAQQSAAKIAIEKLGLLS